MIIVLKIFLKIIIKLLMFVLIMHYEYLTEIDSDDIYIIIENNLDEILEKINEQPHIFKPNTVNSQISNSWNLVEHQKKES